MGKVSERFRKLICRVAGHTDDPDMWGAWEEIDHDDFGPKYGRELRCTRCGYIVATQTVRKTPTVYRYNPFPTRRAIEEGE